jgi:hypothetical protein
LSRFSDQRQGVALFLIGFFCSMAQVSFGIGGGGLGGGWESVNLARHLAESGEYKDPFPLPTGPSALVPPVYPAIMAAAFKVFGDSPSAVAPLLLLNSILLGIAVGVLPWMSARVFGRPDAGFWGGLLMCVSWRMTLQSETTLCAALTALAVCAVFGGRPRLAGLLGGAAMLTNPVGLMGVVIPAFSRGWRFAATVSAVALATCSPWIVRNWLVMGSPYFVRDNLGLELYISNYDRAGAESDTNPGQWEMHPMTNRGETALVKTLGEGPYNRLRMTTATAWAVSHPTRFLQLCGERFFFYWLPRLRSDAPAYGFWVMSLLGAAGVWWSRRNRLALLVAGTAVAYALPYIFVQFAVRYRMPALWTSALLAGYAAAMAVERWGGDRDKIV